MIVFYNKYQQKPLEADKSMPFECVFRANYGTVIWITFLLFCKFSQTFFHP